MTYESNLSSIQKWLFVWKTEKDEENKLLSSITAIFTKAQSVLLKEEKEMTKKVINRIIF